MMEQEDLETILTNFECEELIATFQNSGIDSQNIKKLTPELIKELIPNIGLPMKFSENLEKYISSQLTTDSRNTSTDLTVSILNETQTNSLTTDLLLNRDNLNNYVIVPAEHRGVAAGSLEELLLEPIFPDFDLKTLFQTTPIGLTVLNYYQNNKRLDESHRNRLTDIIIKHIFNYVIKHRLVHEQYNIITSKIVNLFPTEYSGTYYVPAIRKSNSHTGRSILAKGKLIDKCKNLIHNCTEVVPKKRKRKDDSALPEPSANSEKRKLNLNDINEDLRDDVIWLRCRSEPWSDVLEKWQRTFALRRNFQKKSSVNDFLDDWPILKDLRSKVLINLDFDNLFPEASLKLLLNWDNIFSKLFEYKRSSCRDDYAQQLISILNDDTISNENKFTIQISLLPYLYPPKGHIILGKKKFWKFSAAEALEAIICHAKVPGDIEVIIEEQKTKAKNRKQTVQPYVIVEGPNITSIRKAYIIVDEIRYQYNDVKEALDQCFKIYQVFDAKYPPQSEHIWLLIQHGIYDIVIEGDKIIPSVVTVLQHLREH